MPAVGGGAFFFLGGGGKEAFALGPASCHKFLKKEKKNVKNQPILAKALSTPVLKMILNMPGGCVCVCVGGGGCLYGGIVYWGISVPFELLLSM